MIDTQSLKNKILDLAIRGKLTRQLPEDGTAEELYEKIQEEKQALVEVGKIKKEKPLKEIEEGEVPFEIPESWKWVRMSEIFEIINGDRGKNYPAKSTLRKTGIPFISALNLDGKKVVEDENLLCLDDNQYDKLGSGKLEKNDVVICIRGSLGKHGKYQFEKGAIASSLVISRSYLEACLLGDFEMLWLDSSMFPEEIKKYDSGTAQPNLAAKNLELFLFPLPPLAEQKRMLKNVENLFAEIDTIEKLQTQYAADAEILKSKLIDAAIQGKLTEQLPSDGTAEELYQQIQTEKQALISAGKIKKEKPLKEIEEDEIPFEIPESWKWVRLGDLIKISSGVGLTSDRMKEGSIPVYGGNGVSGYHNEALVNEKTIVIGRVGFYCGSVHLTPIKAWVTDNAFITDYPKKYIDRDFLVYALRNMDLRQSNNGAAQPVVSGKKIYPLLFALPPLAEQKRIVDRLQELLRYCK